MQRGKAVNIWRWFVWRRGRGRRGGWCLQSPVVEWQHLGSDDQLSPPSLSLSLTTPGHVPTLPPPPAGSDNTLTADCWLVPVSASLLAVAPLVGMTGGGGTIFSGRVKVLFSLLGLSCTPGLDWTAPTVPAAVWFGVSLHLQPVGNSQAGGVLVPL